MDSPSLPPPTPLTVLVVGDTRLYCDGIAYMLQRDDRFCVLGVAYGADAALQELTRTAPNVALVDIGMPGSLHLIRASLRRWPAAKIVALAVLDSVDNVMRCAEAGASGFVCRSASFQELVDVLECATIGELRCSPKIAGTLLRRVATLAAGVTTSAELPVRELTPRELEIAELIALRLSNKQIAVRLGIEFATVKNHVHNILEKLSVRRRQDVSLGKRVSAADLF